MHPFSTNRMPLECPYLAALACFSTGWMIRAANRGHGPEKGWKVSQGQIIYNDGSG